MSQFVALGIALVIALAMALAKALDMAQPGANVLKLFCLFLASLYKNASLLSYED
jgi:hypothetical protein